MSSVEHEDIINLMVDGFTVRSIARRVGMNELATRRLVGDLAARHNIKYQGTVDDTTYGLDQDSIKFRVFLASKLYDLREQLGGDRSKIARLVGLNRREQIRAESRPYTHDWTISQMSRLAQAMDTTLQEYLNGSI